MNNANKLYDGRKTIIDTFKNKVFPFKRKYPEDEYEYEDQDGFINFRKLDNLIYTKEREVSNELARNFFLVQDLRSLLRKLNETKNTESTKIQVKLIKSGLVDLKNEIKQMSEDENEIERSDETVDIVEKILEYNNQNQTGQGLKILTPSQMLSRLPISVAQLKADNSSEKLKNEIRQLLYSLYRL